MTLQSFRCMYVPSSPLLELSIRELEREIENKIHVPVVILPSSSMALHIALKLLKVEEGDKVVCPTLIDPNTIIPLKSKKVQFIFIDSEPESWNMSPVALERALMDAKKAGELPKVAIVSNIYGHSAKMEQIIDLCQMYQIPVIEDAGDSFGTEYKGKASGTFGTFGIISLGKNKMISMYGGGILVSKDTSLLEQVRKMVANAKEYSHLSKYVPYATEQLQTVDHRIAQRRSIYDIYKTALSDIPGLQFMPELLHSSSNRFTTVFTMDMSTEVNVGKVVRLLKEQHRDVNRIFKPVHCFSSFRQYPFYSHEEEKSIAEILYARGICLPSGPDLSVEEQLLVVRDIRDLFHKSFYQRIGISNSLWKCKK